MIRPKWDGARLLPVRGQISRGRRLVVVREIEAALVIVAAVIAGIPIGYWTFWLLGL